MAEGIVNNIKHRVQATAYRLASKLVAYISAAVALVFIFAGVFIWIAREESLVFACGVFAAGFVLIAIAALVGAAVFGARVRRYEEQSGQSFMSTMRNPMIAGYAFRAARQVKRAPKLALGAALAAGVVIALINRPSAKQS